MKRLVFATMVALAACHPDVPKPPATEPMGINTGAEPPAATDAGASPVSEEKEEPVVPVYEKGDPKTAIMLRRTACFGKCPIYSLGISSSGNVHFIGERFTKKMGYATASIPTEDVKHLLELIAAHHFDKLPTTIPAVATDHPSAIVVVRRGGHAKSVTHDSSANNADATAIEEEIDRVAGSAHWIGDHDESAASAAPEVPPGVFEAMLGDQKKALEKCNPKSTIELAIDELGRGKPKSGDACLKKAIPTLLFPISEISKVSLQLF